MEGKSDNTEPFDFTSVPLDIWKIIIYEQPKSWLFVSKNLGAYAKHLIDTNPRFRPESAENKLFRQAIQKKDINEVKHWLASGQVDPAVYRNWPLRYAAAAGCLEIVQLLMEQPAVNPTACKHEALVYACRNRHCDIVELLLKDKRVDPSCNGNQPIKEALTSGGGRSMKAIINHPLYRPMDHLDFSLARAGFLRGDSDAVKTILGMEAAVPGVGSELLGDMVNIDGVKMLIEYGADPSYQFHRVIRNAVVYDRFEMAQYLLTVPQVDPAVQNNWCLCFAAESGNTKMVKLLLDDPRVDPTARDNYPLRHACQRGQLDVVQLLLKDPRVNPASGSETKPLTHAFMPSKDLVLSAPTTDDPKLMEKLQIIHILLSDTRVDPTFGNNQALAAALATKTPALIQRLLALPAVNPHEFECYEVMAEFNATSQNMDECFANLLKKKPEMDKYKRKI